MDNFNTGMGLDKFTGSSTTPGGGMDTTMYENERNRIAAMPPGPAKEAALAALLRDYAGERDTAKADRELGAELIMEDGPSGTQIGGRYSTYVAASPLEHLASGLRKYKGFKDYRKGQDELDQLSKDSQKARTSMFRSGLGGGTKYGMYNRP